MRKWTLATVSVAAALLAISVISCNQTGIQGSSYGEDRALIEDLQARYMFALDFHDVDKYLQTFSV